jgi:hypothetical protein
MDPTNSKKEDSMKTLLTLALAFGLVASIGCSGGTTTKASPAAPATGSTGK